MHQEWKRNRTQVSTHGELHFILRDESKFCKEKDRVFNLHQPRGSRGRCQCHRLLTGDNRKVWLSQQPIFMAGFAGSLTIFPPTALRGAYSMTSLSLQLRRYHHCSQDSCSVNNRLPRKGEVKLFNFWADTGFLLD